MIAAIEILPADPRSEEAAALIRELSRELSARYSEEDGSGNFKPEDATGPRAAFLIGRTNGRAVACGAIRPLDEDVAELKRMFVLPECRGRGYSKALLQELERLAREYGYTAVRLETGDRQAEAIRLYERFGYTRIPSYSVHADQAWSICFEKPIWPDR